MLNGITSLKNLGYLYFAFAHLTDEVLDDAEINSIRERLHRRAPEMDEKELDILLRNIEHWYNNSAENRQVVIQTLIGEIHFEVDDPALKKSIIEDLESIAKSDHNFSSNEEEFIRALSAAWAIS